jgi:uncharacterized protein with HEPN domain
MVHGYFETNLELVWETIQVFIPDLETKLRLIQIAVEKPD